MHYRVYLQLINIVHFNHPDQTISVLLNHFVTNFQPDNSHTFQLYAPVVSWPKYPIALPIINYLAMLYS